MMLLFILLSLCLSIALGAVEQPYFGIATIPKVVPRAFQRSCQDIVFQPELYPVFEELHRPHSDPKHPLNFLSSWIVGGPRLWTYEPVCLHDPRVSTICVYTSTTFANGRGLSLVTSPEEERPCTKAEAFRGTSDSQEAEHGNVELAETRFRREHFPAKGVGIIATQSIHRGDVIYAKTPLTVQQQKAMLKLKQTDAHLLMQISVERLPKDSRDLFFTMKGQFGANPYWDRVNTNSFAARIGQGTEIYWTVYPEAARLNHDCRPNVQYNINPNTLVHTMHALRSIHPGEEITTSYILPYFTWHERRERTTKQWGFNCSCNLCTAPDYVIERSDDRLLLITSLERELANLSFSATRAAGPSTAEMLVSLYQQERLDGAIAEAYSFAALEYAYVAERRLAQKYAALAVEALQLWRGEWHQATRSFMEMLVYPERHSMWNISAVVREFLHKNGTLKEGEPEEIHQQYGSIFVGYPTARDVRNLEERLNVQEVGVAEEIAMAAMLRDGESSFQGVLHDL
ncbi:SET domain-containing protein [Rhizodiscina lignyota]|uniref:SET domain-containing protein n=1 Tax=Rhizodiscina lignyota TaxID=1504668 RepID=A0A9P4II66_9PEZI|nr:SET domain-containing protein [Rhizodiscina lignyota]